MIISNDNDALSIIKDRLNAEISTIERNILSSVFLLMSDYSFVDNQTYPRPSHPDVKKRKDSYFTLIAIIISLRTTLENEQKAVSQFMNKYNDIDDVINSNVNEIMQIITCAGMPAKKAKTIIELSQIIKEKYSGDITNIIDNSIEMTRNKLLELPGIGDKSADCMLELAFDLPSIVIDINMFRVVSRLYMENSNMNFNNKKDILKVKHFLEDNIYADYKIYQIVHTILLLHGKFICKSKPMCDKCKLKKRCNYYNNNQKTISKRF